MSEAKNIAGISKTMFITGLIIAIAVSKCFLNSSFYAICVDSGTKR